MRPPSKKKIPYRVEPPLHEFLKTYKREFKLPVTYAMLVNFTQGFPLLDSAGNDTKWLTVNYESSMMPEINEGLRYIYVLLKASGDTSIMEHLYVSRIDFCEFGNSKPFRVRIVNAYNDNQDYFYVKKADASRVLGLELEHLLSPNRMHFFVDGDTLVEEHVVGIPGDVFMEKNIQEADQKEIRIAKEFIKFNERCFIRLLGDMRSYNFVMDITPDFEEVQYRIRAMDFDQQCYDGRRNFYKPQYFTENNALIHFGIKYLDRQSARQYQLEERAAIGFRMRVENDRLSHLMQSIVNEPLAPEPKIEQLRGELAEWYSEPAFLDCRTMGEILHTSLLLVEEHSLTEDPADKDGFGLRSPREPVLSARL